MCVVLPVPRPWGQTVYEMTGAFSNTGEGEPRRHEVPPVQEAPEQHDGRDLRMAPSRPRRNAAAAAAGARSFRSGCSATAAAYCYVPLSARATSAAWP